MNNQYHFYHNAILYSVYASVVQFNTACSDVLQSRSRSKEVINIEEELLQMQKAVPRINDFT